MDKKTARKTGLTARSSLSIETRRAKDAEIQRLAIEKIKDAHTVGCYVSINDEVSTSLIRRYCYETGKILAVPRVSGNTLVFHRIESDSDLREGSFHVPEPVNERPLSVKEIDVMFVPLSSFDEEGNRTGYGKGYYDSILKECPHTVGLAYKEQQVSRIEADEWDVRLDEVISI